MSRSDGGFVICIQEGDAKLTQIHREPAVSILVAEHVLPYRGIEVRGVAAVTSEPYGATMRRLALRYFGTGADELYPDTRPAPSSGSRPVGSVAGTSPATWRRWTAAQGDSGAM